MAHQVHHPHIACFGSRRLDLAWVSVRWLKHLNSETFFSPLDAAWISTVLTWPVAAWSSLNPRELLSNCQKNKRALLLQSVTFVIVNVNFEKCLMLQSVTKWAATTKPVIHRWQMLSTCPRYAPKLGRPAIEHLAQIYFSFFTFFSFLSAFSFFLVGFFKRAPAAACKETVGVTMRDQLDK